MRFLLGLIIGLLIIPVWVFFYFHNGHPPVAVADQPFLLEKEIVRVPLQVRIDKEMPASAPIEASATNLTAGAQIYRQQCAACHGLYGRPSDFAGHMYPRAPQLWAPHGNGVVGVSDDPVGETYWKDRDAGVRQGSEPDADVAGVVAGEECGFADACGRYQADSGSAGLRGAFRRRRWRDAGCDAGTMIRWEISA
jgi:mono/diheme cytochrome c family protein